MTRVSNSQSTSSSNKISAHPLVNPIVSYHGKFINVFTKELPPSNKVIEVIKRIFTVVVAPLAFLVLGALGLAGVTLHGMGCLNKRETSRLEQEQTPRNQSQQDINYRKVTSNPPNKHLVRPYKSLGSISNSIDHIHPGKIGLIERIKNDVYTAEAVAPTGEKFFLAMEPMGDGEKWEIYRNTAIDLVNGGNRRTGTIGGLVELGTRINNESELNSFLSSRTYPDFWTSDTSSFNQLKNELRDRKITLGSSNAQALSTIPHASRGLNVRQQTHMVYASKSPISDRISFSDSTGKDGYAGLVGMYGDLIMCVGVNIENVVENRGIFRNPLSVVKGGYGGISMMLHSFTCMTVQENFPSVKSFKVLPLKRMGEIFLKSLPKEKITVEGVAGDKYDKGFEVERDVRVPIKILADLHRAS